MSENSPYDAPESDVAVSSGTSKLSLKEICFSFTGRVPRKVFWIYGVLMLMIGAGIVGGIIGYLSTVLGDWFALLLIPLYIVVVWISLAIQIKRWHDRDKSGWWVLIALVPLVGPIWQLVECGFLESTPGDNRFGPAPADY